jgi:integrase
VKNDHSKGAVAAQFQKVGECLYRHVSGRYYALVKKGGKQIRRSLKTTDRQLAQRCLRDFRLQVNRLSGDAEASRITFDELALRWFSVAAVGPKEKSAARKKLTLKMLSGHFGKLLVRSISPRDCEDWMKARSPKVAASTYNNERETLQAVLGLAKREGLILDNPAGNLVRRKGQKSHLVIPTREQFCQLLAALKTLGVRARHAVRLVEILAYSGIRLGEATALRWGEVDFLREQFLVTGGESGTKNHEARTVPLFPSFRILLEEIRAEPDFVETDRVAQKSDAKKALASACDAAGLPPFHHHSLRHLFVSNAIEQGVDFKTTAAWVG